MAAGLIVVALSLLLFNTLSATSSTLHVIVVFAVLAIGMGNVMAPATDSIMGSLPRSRAGVGSAVNDTTRQVGGAVGVAVLGSLLASRFRSQITHLLGGSVPAPVVAQVKGGVAQALSTAARNPQAKPYASRIIHAADSSFVSGFHMAAVVAAIVIGVAACSVLVWLPSRARDEEPAPTMDAELAPVGGGGS